MTDAGELFVFNPLPWDRRVRGPVSGRVLSVRGLAEDPTASRHAQGRELAGIAEAPLLGSDGVLRSGEGLYWGTQPKDQYLPPVTVPGYGYTTVPKDRLSDPDDWPVDERSIVETDAVRVRFDCDRGGIASWHDRTRDREWVDAADQWPFAGIVHERVADAEGADPRRSLFECPTDPKEATRINVLDGRGWNPDWNAHREGPTGVREHRVYDAPGGPIVRQVLETDAAAIDGDIVLAFSLTTDDPSITVEAAWTMSRTTHPMSTFIAFPVAVDDPTARVDIGGQAMRPGADQLAGTCHDFYTVDRWADLSGPSGGVTVGCPLNPLVQFGDFPFAGNRDTFELETGRLLGWVTNTYWDTNFRARQPGLVRARYTLTPHDGFDEARAHRVGATAECDRPLVHSGGEAPAEPTLPAEGQLLDLPTPPVLVQGIRPIDAPGIDARFLGEECERSANGCLILLKNAADSASTAEIGSGNCHIDAAKRTDRFGAGAGDPVPVTDGEVTVDLAARETAGLRIAWD